MGHFDVSAMATAEMGLNHTSPRKVIFVVSEDWYFVSHRLGLAASLKATGWDVVVATQISGVENVRKIEAAGIRLHSIALKRGSLFAIGDFMYFWRLLALYRQERPDVAHHVAMKPVLWGSLAALFAKRPGVINALAGLGYLFTSRRKSVAVVKAVVLRVFRWLFNRPGTLLILQNRGDVAMFHDAVRVAPDKVRLIRGAGVDVTHYLPAIHQLRSAPVVVMVARMLRDKGVAEFVEAAKLLQQRGISVKMLAVGGVDPANPNSFSESDMKAFHDSGAIEWLGHRTDIAAIYSQADIAVLPSYREGLPKSLLEAAACGLPIVATDAWGCREVVFDGENGYLVPIGDGDALARAIAKLAQCSELRAQMGSKSRTIAETEFTQEQIWEQTSRCYQDVMA